MNDAHTPALPPLAELFLHVVLFVLPRDCFARDRGALLRLASVRKRLVEDMHASSGGFALDLHMSARSVVMLSPYPGCHLACFNISHFQALKNAAARFQSINRLCIDLQQLPAGCNFVSTQQILGLAFHCLSIGRARHLRIAHAVLEADQFTHCLAHLFPATKAQILSVDLSHCKLDINSQFLRELASLRNMTSLTLDGNNFHLVHSAVPAFSDKLERLSVAGCPGIRASVLQKISKALHTLSWSENALEEDDKPEFLSWLADSRLQKLEIDNCGFSLADGSAFMSAFERMPALRSLSMAGNYLFQDDVFWSLYDVWKQGRLRSSFFCVHISNMHVCYPDSGIRVLLAARELDCLEQLTF
jgi:hypothetical protein